MIGYTDDTRERVYLTNATFDALFTVLADAPRIMPAAQYNTLSAALSDAYMPDPLSDSPQEKWYRNQDGSTFCCQVSSVTLKDDQGKAMICLSTLQDITERKHVEQALRDSEAKFRNFFEHGGVPYTLAIHQEDLGERSFTYLYNDAFAHLVAKLPFLMTLIHIQRIL